MRHTTNTSPFPSTWEQRQVATGTELPAGEERNLVVEVRAVEGARTASAGPIEIVYEDERGGRAAVSSQGNHTGGRHVASGNLQHVVATK